MLRKRVANSVRLLRVHGWFFNLFRVFRVIRGLHSLLWFSWPTPEYSAKISSLFAIRYSLFAIRYSLFAIVI
jgi:hypothetical protein